MIETYIEKLQHSSLKITPKRRAIIEIFYRGGRFLTPEEVFDTLRRRFAHCGLPSVYRNLESLTECGILARIFKDDNKRYYGLCHAKPGDHHHHIVCIRCGRVGVISGCDLFKKKIIDGFRVVDHFLQLDGVCASCRKN